MFCYESIWYKITVAQHAGKLHFDVYFVEMSLAGVQILLLVCPFHTVYMFNLLSISRRSSLYECVKWNSWIMRGLAKWSLFAEGTKWQLVGPVCMDSVPGILAFNCATLFPLALTCPYCCIACGQLLVCHTHSKVISCDWAYLAAALWIHFMRTVIMHILMSKSRE